MIRHLHEKTLDTRARQMRGKRAVYSAEIADAGKAQYHRKIAPGPTSAGVFVGKDFPLKDYVASLASSGPLTDEDTALAFESMLDGKLAPADIAAILTGWSRRKETAAELIAGARAMRTRSVKLSLPPGLRPLTDNCGTGGDGSNSFNVSTASAIVAAASGACIAKHGNRSVSSRSGSADLLFAAGFPENLAPAATVTLLEKTGLSFFFAPQFHPSIKHVMPVRKALGVRTVFNFLGPLANPLAPERQLIGVGTREILRPMAEALAALGIERGLVVHGRDGVDELSAAAITDGYFVDGGKITVHLVDPATLGLCATAADLAGGSPVDNLLILNQLLAGKASRGLTDAIALNAGATLWLAGKVNELGEGVETTRQSIATGEAKAFCAHWLQTAQELAAEGAKP